MPVALYVYDHIRSIAAHRFVIGVIVDRLAIAVTNSRPITLRVSGSWTVRIDHTEQSIQYTWHVLTVADRIVVSSVSDLSSYHLVPTVVTSQLRLMTWFEKKLPLIIRTVPSPLEPRSAQREHQYKRPTRSYNHHKNRLFPFQISGNNYDVFMFVTFCGLVSFYITAALYFMSYFTFA